MENKLSIRTKKLKGLCKKYQLSFYKDKDSEVLFENNNELTKRPLRYYWYYRLNKDIV